MSSSASLDLVNIILRTTGDAKEVATIAGSTGGIAERTIDFFNLTINQIERMTNWPALRVNSQGTANGVDDIYEFSGVDDVRVGSAVSVWIAAQDRLTELTPEQFDAKLAQDASGGLPLYFQRGVSGSGKLQIQIFPLPASGTIINVSGYKKATKFVSTSDTTTTEFDDDILVYGALMHIDLYDGQDRGYASLFKDQMDATFIEIHGNRQIHMEVESYQ